MLFVKAQRIIKRYLTRKLKLVTGLLTFRPSLAELVSRVTLAHYGFVCVFAKTVSGETVSGVKNKNKQKQAKRN